MYFQFFTHISDFIENLQSNKIFYQFTNFIFQFVIKNCLYFELFFTFQIKTQYFSPQRTPPIEV